jgi:tetratricopeptide (TPR) repeat protein
MKTNVGRSILAAAGFLAGLIFNGAPVFQLSAQTSPKAWQAYSGSAAEHIRMARDTRDVAQYNQAESDVQHLLQLSPGNYDGQKLQVAVLLGKHEFANALKLATELNRKVPDDINGWSLLVDINAAIGAYAEAERDAQWILDLRPGSVLGFEKAAGLRELFGDAEGAIEFYQEAIRRTSQNDLVQRSWLLTQVARLQLASGNVKQAQLTLDQSLALFPSSQLAAAVSADIRIAEGKYAEAAAVRERMYRGVANPENLYVWAEVLEKAGLNEQAAAAFKDFETRASAQMNAAYNANQDLIYFYTDHKQDPAKALKIAQREESLRQDEGTLAAAAWAFFQNGKYTEARNRMDRALSVGIKNPVYFCHAAQIAAKTNDQTALANYQKELASFSPNTCAANLPIQTAKEVIK